MKETIKEGLERFYPNGQVTEIRFFAGKRAYSGLYTDMSIAARAAQVGNEHFTVYFTPNPVDMSKVGKRQLNKPPRKIKKGEAISDNQILQRNFILIDVDPKRKGGISSTDEQLADAHAVAERIVEYLEEFKIDFHSVAMSGNGFHVNLRCNLSASDNVSNMVNQFLKALKRRFETETVGIDTAVSNVSRIWKIYGTYSRKKGTQRLAEIVAHNQDAANVSLSDLQAVIDATPDKQRKTAKNAVEGSQDDIEARIAAVLRNVQEVESGEIHNTVNRIAYTLGGYVASGYISEEDAEERIIEAIDSNPSSEGSQAHIRTIGDGLRDGQGEPLVIEVEDIGVDRKLVKKWKKHQNTLELSPKMNDETVLLTFFGLHGEMGNNALWNLKAFKGDVSEVASMIAFITQRPKQLYRILKRTTWEREITREFVIETLLSVEETYQEQGTKTIEDVYEAIKSENMPDNPLKKGEVKKRLIDLIANNLIDSFDIETALTALDEVLGGKQKTSLNKLLKERVSQINRESGQGSMLPHYAMYAYLMSRWDVTQNELSSELSIDENDPGKIIDHIVLSLSDKFGGTINKSKTAVNALGSFRTFNPIREFLNALVWDGNDHIGTAVAAMKLDDESAILFEAWLMQLYRKAMDNESGKHQNYALIIDGEQGIGKSTFIESLVPSELRQTSNIDPDNKDDIIRLTKSLIWNLDELQAVTRKADKEALKSLITKSEESFRIPYATYGVTKRLYASFCGSVNDTGIGFLNDNTGSRRWAVIRSDVPSGEKFADAWLDIPQGQIIAQAKDMYLRGELKKDRYQNLYNLQMKKNGNYKYVGFAVDMFKSYYDYGKTAVPAIRDVSNHEDTDIITISKIVGFLTSEGLKTNQDHAKREISEFLLEQGCGKSDQLNEYRVNGIRKSKRGFRYVRIKPLEKRDI